MWTKEPGESGWYWVRTRLGQDMCWVSPKFPKGRYVDVYDSQGRGCTSWLVERLQEEGAEWWAVAWPGPWKAKE